MASSFVHAPHTRQGARERDRYRAQRHPESRGYFTVTEPLCPQVKTTTVLLRQRAQNGLHTFMPLAACRLFLGVERRGRLLLGQGFIEIRGCLGSLVGAVLFQRQVMRYPKNPTAKISPRFP
jgi:hypothetical protein